MLGETTLLYWGTTGLCWGDNFAGETTELYWGTPELCCETTVLGSQLSCTGGDQIIGNPFTIIKMFYGMSERERERGSLKYETKNDIYNWSGTCVIFTIGLAFV